MEDPGHALVVKISISVAKLRSITTMERQDVSKDNISVMLMEMKFDSRELNGSLIGTHITLSVYWFRKLNVTSFLYAVFDIDDELNFALNDSVIILSFAHE